MKSIIYILGLLIFAFIAKTPDDKRSILIEEALQKRIEGYHQEQWEKCKAKAIDDAIALVDSLIADELGPGPVDTTAFPEKPVRPNFESYDSLKKNLLLLKPLFDSTQIDK